MHSNYRKEPWPLTKVRCMLNAKKGAQNVSVAPQNEKCCEYCQSKQKFTRIILSFVIFLNNHPFKFWRTYITPLGNQVLKVSVMVKIKKNFISLFQNLIHKGSRRLLAF